MASEVFSGSEAIGAGEHSFTTDSGSPDAETSDGTFQLWLDLSDMVTSDELVVRVYEKVLAGSTQRSTNKWYFFGPQSDPNFSSIPFILLHGWRMTGQVTAGGTINVDWSIRKA